MPVRTALNGAGRPLRRASPIAALLLAVAAFACSRDGGGDHARDGAPERPRSLLLVTIDTLRADRLGCYGYALDTTPRLDRLAAKGTRFARALAPVGRTTPSLATILTGKALGAHGVLTLHQPLAVQHDTLAERFARAGYDTGAVVVIPFLRPGMHLGLDQGFAEFELLPKEQRASAVTDRAIAMLDRFEARGDRPFFLWVHYRDPHAPYYPPEPFRDRFDAQAATYDGPFQEYFHYWPVTPEQETADGVIDAHDQERKGKLKFGHTPPSERDASRIAALYDGDVAYTDDEVGRLLDVMAARGLDDVAVAVTADHGESLGEHDFFYDHGEFVYDTCLRVPLILSVPGASHVSTVVEEQVGLVDLAPTLVELFGLPPLQGVQGESFAAALTGGSIAPRRVLAESGEPLMWPFNPRFAGRAMPPNDPAHRLRAICLPGGEKLVYDPLLPDDRAFTWFDPRHDPHETDPRKPRREGTAMIEEQARTLARLAAGVAIDPADEEQRRLLEQAGYASGR